jgi:signal transduction histidine kinase
VQEALTNVVKHSQATEISVQLITKFQGQSQSLQIQVKDNGQGFDPSKNTSGFGLRGMQERAIALGGTLHVWSAPGTGCRISVNLPISQPLGYPAQVLLEDSCPF